LVFFQQLVQLLKKRGLTYIGTYKSNNREIPQEFLANRSIEVGSSLFGFTNDDTSVSFSKKGKICDYGVINTPPNKCIS
jgi:hypothetical protein